MSEQGFPSIALNDGLRYRNIVLEERRRALEQDFPWPGLEESFEELSGLSQKKLTSDKKALVSHGKSGPDIATDAVRRATEVVNELRHGDPSLVGDKFEAAAAPQIFEILGDLPYYVLVEPDFWRYVALRHFADVIMWRHPVKGRTVVPGGGIANWGLGSASELSRCVPFRIFLRGQVSRRNELKGGRNLAELGDVDIWASHVLSQSYASHTPMADAQFDGIAMMRRHSVKNTVAHLRELPKRLRVVRSDIVFEVMDLEQCNALVAREVEEFDRGADSS